LFADFFPPGWPPDKLGPLPAGPLPKLPEKNAQKWLVLLLLYSMGTGAVGKMSIYEVKINVQKSYLLKG
jgi:hypothetical protein